MEIPDCYDPVRQEEERQADWDRFVEKLPVCTLCRKTILPGGRMHTAGLMVVCSSCVEELNDDYEIVEEEKL